MATDKIQKVILIDFLSKGYSLYSFGLYALRAYALKHVSGINIEIISIHSNDNFNQKIIDIAQLAPDIIGFSCFVWSEQQVYAASQHLRSLLPNIFIIFGGPQVEIGDSQLASAMISGVVDVAVCGEGELPFVAILDSYTKNKLELLEHIAGVSIVKGNAIKWNLPRNYGKVFEESSNPVIDDEELLKIACHTGIFVYETARGCPYQCTFCDQGVKVFRSRPMKKILEDLQNIIDQKPRKIVFLDSTFNVSLARTKQLLKPIIESGIEVEIEGEVKPERCDAETIQLMRMAGFRSVEVGLQSIKSGTLQFIKRNNNFHKIEKSISQLIEANIEVHVDTIIGLPGETLSDWLATIDYCFSLGNVIIFSNSLKILPNSEIKYQITDLGFNYAREKTCAVIKTDAMDNNDINIAKMHQKMIKYYWNRSENMIELRKIILKYYHGHLSAFTRDALAALSSGESEKELKTIRFWLNRCEDNFSIKIKK